MTKELTTTALAVIATFLAACGLVAWSSGNCAASVSWWAAAFILKTIEVVVLRSQAKSRLIKPTR